MQHVTDRRVDPIASKAAAETLSGAQSVDLAIAGMGCSNCANRIRNALLAIPPVLEVRVNVPSSLAHVWYDGSRIGIAEIVAAVGVIGETTHHRFIAEPVGIASKPVHEGDRPERTSMHASPTVHRRGTKFDASGHPRRTRRTER